MASRNHNPKPFMNPLPSAFTRSLTILPSSRATKMLRTVLRMRKAEWRVSTPTSLLLHRGLRPFPSHDGGGRTIRSRSARSCFKNDTSMFGFFCTDWGSNGKCFLSFSNFSCGIGRIGTYQPLESRHLEQGRLTLVILSRYGTSKTSASPSCS